MSMKSRPVASCFGLSRTRLANGDKWAAIVHRQKKKEENGVDDRIALSRIEHV